MLHRKLNGLHSMLDGVNLYQAYPPGKRVLHVRKIIHKVNVSDNGQSPTLTTSTPLSFKAWLAGFDGSRVIPLILNCWDKTGCSSTPLITEPPWLPVAPKTTRSLLMMELLLGRMVCYGWKQCRFGVAGVC